MSKPSNIPLQIGDDNAIDHQAFSEKNIRVAFIRKVYSILAAQLAVTVFLIFITSKNSPPKSPLKITDLSLTFLITAIFTCFVILAIFWIGPLLALCRESVARKTPINYICLFLFTIGEGFCLGLSAANFKAEQVLLAVGITILIFLLSTVFAFQTKIDFTAYHESFIAFQSSLVIPFIVLYFIPEVQPVRVFFLFSAGLIFTLLLISETQLMIAGDHQFYLPLEDDVIAALWIYVDIVNIPFGVSNIYLGWFKNAQKQPNEA